VSDGSATLASQFGSPGDAFDDSASEHIYIGDEFAERASGARTVSERAVLSDRLRGRDTSFTFYSQGFLEVRKKRGSKAARSQPIDLRYLDPVPTVELCYPRRLMKATASVAGTSALLAGLAAFGLLSSYTAPAAALAVATTAVLAIWCFYLSHERICFYTLHGRANALQINAGLGSVGRYRKILPTMMAAIENAANSVGDDTMVYLRSEMQEHYRLRSEGVLSETECSDSTSRILSHFDEPL
jgi:hypothetical protein